MFLMLRGLIVYHVAADLPQRLLDLDIVRDVIGWLFSVLLEGLSINQRQGILCIGYKLLGWSVSIFLLIGIDVLLYILNLLRIWVSLLIYIKISGLNMIGGCWLGIVRA